MRAVSSLFVALATAFLLIVPTRADTYDDAVAAMAREDYRSAFQLFHSLAEQGRSQAQFMLGTLYAGGKGVTQDYSAAVNWYQKAAENGDANAGFSLGSMYA